MLFPLSLITPESGTRAPDTRLNSVVLPAPLGPIRPTISPWFTWKSTRVTAASPPKCLVTPSPSRIRMLPRPPSVPPLLHEAHQAMGQEHDDNHQDHAGQKHVIIGELGEQQLLQIGENSRAQDRTI